MATTDLITATVAKQNATLAALSASSPETLDALISAASVGIQGYCMRQFNLSDYSEYYDGPNYPYCELKLRQWPVTKVTRLAINPQQVISIQNTDTNTNQFADVATTDDGIGNCLSVVLNRVASAVTATNTLTAASYPTLAALASAINLLGGGWSATVSSGFTLYPVSMLRPLQGNVSAMNAAQLEMYLDQPMYAGSGNFWGDPSVDIWGASGAWRMDAICGLIYGRFPAGARGIRIDYTAGFATIPPDLQQACVRVIALTYENSRRDSALQSEKIGPYSQTFITSARGALQHPDVLPVLNKYRAHDKLAVN